MDNEMQIGFIAHICEQQDEMTVEDLVETGNNYEEESDALYAND